MCQGMFLVSWGSFGSTGFFCGMEQFSYESGKEMMLKLLEKYLLLFPLQITEKDGFSPWK